MDAKQPKTIFEQLVFGLVTTNENLGAVAERVDAVSAKLDMVLAALSATPIETQSSEPTTFGAEQPI
jgi:hypothetical protein